MPEERRKLGEAELEIMQALWQAGEALTAPRVLEALPNRSWAMGTLITVLQRLVQKGYLACEKRPRASTYAPLVTKEDYLAGEGKSFLERLYGNSLRTMVASFYGGKVIGENDLAELRRYLAELQEGGAEDA